VPQEFINLMFDLGSRFTAIPSRRQEVIVIRFPVADMSLHRKQHSGFIKTLSRRGTADSPAVLATGMFRDLDLSLSRTVGKDLSIRLANCST